MKGLSTITSFSPANEALKKTNSIPVAAAPSVPSLVTSMTELWMMLLIPEQGAVSVEIQNANIMFTEWLVIRYAAQLSLL